MALILGVLAQNESVPTGDGARGYIALMGLGFIVGTAGHVVKSKPMIAAGVIMIFLATVLIPLGVRLTD